MIKQAAIYHQGTVYVGDRHRNIISTYKPTIDLSKAEQGFITSNHLFVSREEAAKIALACGQIKKPKKKLISEDLY